MGTKPITGNFIVEQLRANLYTVADKYLESLSRKPNGNYAALGMKQAIEEGNEMGIITQLPNRTFGDSFFKNSIQETMAIHGHDVELCDTRNHDSIECGKPREYKAARLLSSTGSLRIHASNPTKQGNVRVELFVADGDSLDQCGFYALNKSALDRFGSAMRNNKGWALNISKEALTDPEGLGAWRMTADEYARNRTRSCRCK